ncbi:pleckstrin homology domain-containing family A member 7 isoform X2 [Bombina bombina]|uniref:pleckstrin homology domain-containing family A member 7 isoform X2 n=1 Tax=Bombina bombina TaxID=8345 RepID=UPI00235AC812|nr:pleckstrin homology domain-containing family A member 7 isoform X2 [Bombina bombina]
MTEEIERPRSGLSMASSVVTTASMSTGSRPPTRAVKRVHTFGKREYSIKRDPNSPVVIRGWLYKQDSSGLRLWKRRWFVLSDFCLFYYRDSREETVLGSILLPSYEILPASPREVKNRRFSFKAEHPGMRTYYFGADTHEDMNAWIRAMNQSALVVAEDKNKSSRGHHLADSPHDDLYASYEDFSHTTIGPGGEHAKSAESLEIAQLSETRSQDESSRESLPEQDRSEDLEKDSLFSGLRESLSDAMQHFTFTSQSGSVPPPTPENGLKNMEFACNKQDAESKKSIERNDSIPEDEEWAPVHKDQTSFKESESYCTRSPSRLSQKGFECPHDVYASPHSRSAPSSPAIAPAHMYSSEIMERVWGSRDKKLVSQSELSDSLDSRNLTPSSTERPEYVVQRIVKASRSYSLPPTPSDLSRPRISKRGSPPNAKYGSPLNREKATDYSDTSHAKNMPNVGSPTRRAVPNSPNFSPKVQANQSQVASNEDLAVPGSPSQIRLPIRSNAPIGRVDIVPSEDRSGTSAPISRHNEERTGEYFVTSSRTRSHIVKSSRPQTPSDRYDVLPHDDTYSSSTMVKGPSRYSRRSQPLGAEDDRMVDGCGIPLPSRTHPSNRLQMRPNASAERVIVEEYPVEMSLTPSLRRHRNQAPRYSERTLLPPTSGRAIGCPPRHLTKMGSVSYSQLPPLPPVSNRGGAHVPAGKRMSLSAVPTGPAQYRERVFHPVRLTENSIDVLLTKMCGQDRLLVSLEDESDHLRAEKEKLEDALQLTHHHLDEFQGQEHVIENIWYQQRLLQDDLVYIRARLCDLSLERERAWEEYRALENDLHALRETLERVSQIGHPQDQAAAQRDLWMINDIISGLRFNKSNFHVIPETTRHPAIMSASPVSEQPTFPRSFLHHSGLNSVTSRETDKDPESVPPRPPLPKDHQTTPSNRADKQIQGHSSDQNEKDQFIEQHIDAGPIKNASSCGDNAPPSKDLIDIRLAQSSCPVFIPTSHKLTTDVKASPPNMPEVSTVRKQRMSAEEQMERMRRHQEAQIHEKPKPGVTTQRQNSQRGNTPTFGGRIRSTSSDSLPAGPNAKQMDKSLSEERKPALVRVTASFYPTTSTPQPGKYGTIDPKPMTPNMVKENKASSQSNEEEPTYSFVFEPQTESVTSTRSHDISSVAKLTPPVRTSSKIVTAACMQIRKDNQEFSEDKNEYPSVFSNETTNTSHQPEQLEVKRKTVERTKTKASPGTSPGGHSSHSDEGYTGAMEGQRERIISLSYTLATEASQRSKFMTSKSYADNCDATSDGSSSEETYPWDFILQDSYSNRRGSDDQCQFKATSSSLQKENNADNQTKNSEVLIISKQGSLEGTSGCSLQHTEAASSRGSDNVHYENWSSQREQGHPERCMKPESTTPSVKCNGQVTNYNFLIEDLHYHPFNISKVADFCKEEREPIRITLLQSSF